MSRIQTTFAALKEAGRSALIPYIAAGDPHPGVTVEMLHGMADAGADIIELGIPFSDPMVDGPVIQRAAERALEHHVSLTMVLTMVSEFRKTNDHTPIILMGYVNPVERYGYERFAKDAVAAGVDGVITVDLPPNPMNETVTLFKAAGLDPIFLIAPTTKEERIKEICTAASGFVYYVSLKGVTGAAGIDVAAVSERLALIRNYTDLPLGVGFGISDGESAAKVGKVADAVIVGSAMIKRMEAVMEQGDQAMIDATSGFTEELRLALDKQD